MDTYTLFFISHSELETEKILTNRELLEIMCKIYRNFVVCGSLKRIPPKSLTVINRLQAKVFKSLKCLLWIERDYIIRDYIRDNKFGAKLHRLHSLGAELHRLGAELHRLGAELHRLAAELQ